MLKTSSFIALAADRGPASCALHFVLQFVEQPAKLRRVLLGACEFDRPIIRAAEVSVKEAVQVDSRPLKPGRAPCEALPRHSVVFLFHRFLVPSNFGLALCRDAGSSLSVRPPRAAIEWWS